MLVALATAAAARFPLEPSANARLKALLERRRAGKSARADAGEGAVLARLLVGNKALPAASRTKRAVPAAAGRAKRG